MHLRAAHWISSILAVGSFTFEVRRSYVQAMLDHSIDSAVSAASYISEDVLSPCFGKLRKYVASGILDSLIEADR
jgi:hypothetical protein